MNRLIQVTVTIKLQLDERVIESGLLSNVIDEAEEVFEGQGFKVCGATEVGVGGSKPALAGRNRIGGLPR